MSEPALPVEYRGGGIVLRDASLALPRHPRHRYGRRWRRLREVIVHHTAGATTPGWRGLYDTAYWHVTGRAWPGIGYHFYVPHAPEEDAGDLVVYRCNPDDLVSWHATSHNGYSIGIVCQGDFRSRWHPGGGEPSPAQLAALDGLWALYLRGRLGLTDAALVPHSLAGKPACPGETLERWALDRRRAALHHG